MRRSLRHAVLLLTLLAAQGCGASGGGASTGQSRPRARADLITLEEMQRAQFSNAHELVTALRPRWLHGRGDDTILGEPAEVQVVMDGVKLGGVGALRNVTVAGIGYLQFFDPMTAASRWGPGFQNGAIYISSRTR